MFYLILFNYHLLIIQLLINFIFCLNCFDSQSPIPIKVTKCKEEEVCYVEYYSLKTEQNLKELVHYFDRFCVNKRHCTDRGIWPEYKSCINLTQLDKMVAKTFERKLRSERLDPSKIVFTYFCCCSDYDKCNELGPNKLRLLFNLSISEEKYSQTIYSKQLENKRKLNNGNIKKIINLFNIYFLFIVFILKYLNF